jgi:uncharacterized damage-inducible protein DinB
MHSLIVWTLALAFPVLVLAQGSAKEPLLKSWNDSARKLVAIATEFPESKYDYKPTPEVRSFAQQLLHVAFWNRFLAAKMKGQNPDGKQNELPRSEYKTRAAVVDVVRKSFEEAVAALKAMPDDQVLKNLGYWDGFLGHNAEHYGQLVVYYRLNGLVPPESRPKK